MLDTVRSTTLDVAGIVSSKATEPPAPKIIEWRTPSCSMAVASAPMNTSISERMRLTPAAL